MDLKKSALALMALGLTGVATAGGFMPAPACTNHPVTVPCERSAWDLGVTAYWLRPANDETTTESLNTVNSSSTTNYAYTPDSYKFGFGLEGSYHWGTGNSLTLSWMHFDRSMSDAFPDAQSSTATFSTAGADYDFDALVLDMGQRIDVGPNWDLDLRFGGEYTKFEQSILYAFNTTQATVDSGNYTADFQTSKFRGIGPHAGFDSQYNIGSGFGLVGRSSVALLVGNMKASGYDSAQFVNGNVTGTPTTTALGRRHAVVAGLDGKLGLNYTHVLSQGSLTLEGGYTVSKFINMSQSSANALSVDNVGQTHAFSLDGWYATLKYVS